VQVAMPVPTTRSIWMRGSFSNPHAGQSFMFSKS
jgi:hypothetical protein